MESRTEKLQTSTFDREDYVIVVCRLCGSEWWYPKQYEREFDADHPLENCAFCRRNSLYRLRSGF